MAITTIKDVNGKELQIDMSKVRDINGDIGNGSQGSSITDSVMKNRVTKVHDIEYIDQKGQVLDSLQLMKDMQDGKVKVYALDVEMEATHSGKNHNYCIYNEDSMEKDAESFLNPFKKPMLKNHNDYSGEPLGRIHQSYYGPSNLTDERGAIHLKARVTDQDAIPKFLDGRYATVSIGGVMGNVTCNVCGKTILKDGKFKFCGHWRGEVYQDQMCYWSVKDIEYNEVSTVNNPADDFAQITKVTVITDKEKEEDSTQKGDNAMEDNTQPAENEQTQDAQAPTTATVADSSDIRSKLYDAIDSILGTVIADPEPTATTADSENKDNTSVTDSNAENPEKTVEDYKTELEEANAKIADLNSQLEAANQSITDLTTERDTAIADAQAKTDQCVELAKVNREMVIDSILDVEKVEDAKVEERKTELTSKSMKELAKVLGDARKQPTQRVQASVENPTLANTNEPNAEVVDSEKPEEQETVKDNQNNKRTVDDYANEIISKLCK